MLQVEPHLDRRNNIEYDPRKISFGDDRSVTNELQKVDSPLTHSKYELLIIIKSLKQHNCFRFQRASRTILTWFFL